MDTSHLGGERRLDLAIQLMRLGQLDGALDQLRALLAEDPEDGRAHALLASVLLDQKRLTAAEHEARLALLIEPEGTLALHVSARVAIAKRDFDRAKVLLDQLSAQNPGDAEAKRWQARVAGLQGRREERGRLLEAALALDPEDADLLSDLADHHFECGRIDEAERWAVRALELEPGHADSLVSMGFILLRRGRVTEAREHAIWALQQDPSDERALALLVAVKARSNFFLGLWWRWSAFMGSLGDHRAVLVLLAAFVLYRVVTVTAAHYEYEDLARYIQFLWLGIVAYTWIGAGIFQSALRRELQTVVLRKDF